MAHADANDGLDVPALAEQLLDDAVAFTNPSRAKDDAIQEPIRQSLQANHGLAVVDAPNPASVGWGRDVAAQLQEITGLDTVIVQRPASASAVSDTYSRAAIESAQAATTPGQDQTAFLQDFYAGLSGTEGSGVALLTVLSLLAVCALAASFRAAKQNS